MKEEHQAKGLKKFQSFGLVIVGGTLAGWYQKFFFGLPPRGLKAKTPS